MEQVLVPLPGFELSGYMDMSTVPVPEFNLPNTSLSWPELELDYKAIHDLLDETAQQCMEVVMEVLETLQAQANRQLRGAMQEIAKALVDILELKDYQPPKYQGSRDSIDSLEEELEYQSERGKEMQTWMERVLDNLLVQALNLQVDDISVPELPKANYSFSDNGTRFEYLDMSLPSITLPKFIAFLVWLTANIWMLDIVIHLIRVRKVEQAYARGAIPKLPEIKFDDEEDKSESYHTKYLMMVAIVRCLLSLHLIVLAVFCMLFFVGAVTWWFPHVHQSCVDTREGTVLSRTAVSPLINLANAPGNAQYYGAKATCQQSQRKLCTDIAGKAEAKHQTDWTVFHTIQAQHNQSLEALSLLEDCLESDTMSALMNESCCGLKGYNTTGCQFPDDLVCPIDSTATPPTAFLPLETYLSNAACQPEFEWSLSDAQYDCKGLTEVCDHIPCAGVDEDLIRFHAIEADCKAQEHLIQYSWFVFWALVHAIVINAICTLVLTGIRTLTWQHLNPNGFKFTSNLNSDATISRGSTQEERLEEMEKQTSRVEMWGKLQLHLGFLLLVVYLIAFTVLVAANN
ncbi:MAG: hypothetical protein SGILL_002542 [Bacillariaceae sp.]